jgi:hypothetical protein
MLLVENIQTGEEEVSKKKAGELEDAGTHTIRFDSNDKKYYAKKKVSGGTKKGEEEVTKKKAGELEDAGTHTIRFDPTSGKYYAKKKTSSEGGSTTYPPTPFKNSKESDAFRTWLLSTYPEYGDKTKKGKDSVDSPPQPKYTNSKSLRKAYSEKGKEYETYLKGGTATDKQDDTKPKDGKPTDQQQVDRKKEIEQRRQTCSSWEDSYFDKEFGSAYRNVEAGKFAQWVERKFPRIFNELSKSEGDYCGVDKYYRFLTYPTLYKHRFLKTLSDAVVGTDSGNQKLFDLWFSQREKKQEKKKESELKISNVDGEIKVSGELPKTASEFIRPSYLELVTSSNIASDNNFKLGDCRKLVNRYYDESKKDVNSIGIYGPDFENEQSVIKSNLKACLSKHNVGLGPHASDVTKLSMQKAFVLENTSIKNKLVEIHTNKQIKESIVTKLKERKSKEINSIFEHYEKQNYKKFFDLLMTESKRYNSQTLVNEESSLTFQQKFDSMFQNDESISTFKEKGINHILTSLKVTPESPIGVEIKKELDSLPNADVSKLVSDPNFVASKVTSAISKTLISPTTQGEGGLKDIIQNNTISSLKSTMDDIKFQVADNLRDMLTKTKTNLETTSDEIKKSFIEKLKEKVTGA